MNRTLTTLCALALALTSAGCTLVVGQLDDRKPGTDVPDDGPATGLGTLEGGLATHLDGIWKTECIAGADDQGRQYTFTVNNVGENQTEIDFAREDNPGCATDGEAWIEYIEGELHPTMPVGGVFVRGALGHGNDAYGLAFVVSSHEMQLYTDDAAEDANGSLLYGKGDWAAEVDVDLLTEVDIGDGALAASDVMAVFMILDSEDQLRMASPVREDNFDPSAPALELAGADEALIAGPFTRQ